LYYNQGKKIYEPGRECQCREGGISRRSRKEEAELPGSSISSVARKYEVHPNQLFIVAEGSEELVVLKQLKAEIRELQRLLGKVEIDPHCP
jgi:transposase-like protein